MDQGPLVTEEIEAGADLVRRFDAYKPIKVAFWLKVAEDASRYLYLASDDIGSEDIRTDYGEVSRLAGEMRNPYLDPFRVKLIGGKTPLAKAIADLFQHGVARTMHRDRIFGDTYACEVYLYPQMRLAPV